MRLDWKLGWPFPSDWKLGWPFPSGWKLGWPFPSGWKLGSPFSIRKENEQHKTALKDFLALQGRREKRSRTVEDHDDEMDGALLRGTHTITPTSVGRPLV